MLRGQWLDFVRDNHVQEGDICLLLPAKTGRKFTLTVYLLRATETHSSGGSGTGLQRFGPCHGKSIKELASPVHIKEESTDGIKDETQQHLCFLNHPFLMVEKLFAGEHVSLESSMKEISDGSLNSNDSGGPCDPPYIVPGKSCLSRSQKKIVEAKVRSIQSEVPIYIVIMKSSSVVVSKQMLVSSILIFYIELFLILRIVVVVYWPEC